ncbi:Plant self-incompatibility S1 [Dillenia turbinata]|uniref:S-protein homolog n=1 Tax=Dillenia turbinata TaxID=194707 RepID=A0AAN8Z4G7_9MAGN
MSPQGTTPFLLVMLVISAASIQCEARWGKNRVEIHNALGDGVDLNVECRSKKGSLGPQLIHSGGYYSFKFFVWPFGDKIYLCDFKWGSESKSFAVFDQRRDRRFDYLVWKILPTGPCMLDHDQYSRCDPWTSKVVHGDIVYTPSADVILLVSSMPVKLETEVDDYSNEVIECWLMGEKCRPGGHRNWGLCI